MEQGYLPVPTFDYSSAFNFRGCLSEDFSSHLDEDHFEASASKRLNQDRFQQFLYYLLTTLAFLFFLITVPISSFFCIKKVNSLQRCQTYRLGNRLPLQGPGYILKLPFIDHISIIDLYEDRFNIIESEMEVLTSDGSIISLRPCVALLNVTNAVLTTLKIGQVNVKECLRLRFSNVIRSKHVEDLENKMHFVVRQYEENCNRFLKRWGYSFKLEGLPRFTVLERADPINPIKTKLNQLLNPGENALSSPSEALLNLLGPLVPKFDKPSPSEQAAKHEVSKLASSNGYPLSDIELTRTLPVLQSFLEQYKSYLDGNSSFAVELLITDPIEKMRRHGHFQYSNGSIHVITIVPAHIDITLSFTCYSNYDNFLISKDMKYLQYSLN